MYEAVIKSSLHANMWSKYGWRVDDHLIWSGVSVDAHVCSGDMQMISSDICTLACKNIILKTWYHADWGVRNLVAYYHYHIDQPHHRA
jgi:hypothetical protein